MAEDIDTLFGRHGARSIRLFKPGDGSEPYFFGVEIERSASGLIFEKISRLRFDEEASALDWMIQGEPLAAEPPSTGSGPAVG